MSTVQTDVRRAIAAGGDRDQAAPNASGRAHATSPGAWRVAYVLTHYPRVALTFISEEIDAVERMGGQIVPFVVNPPVEADLRGPGAERRVGRSLYLKSMPAAIAAATARAVLRHPLGMAKLLATALGTARWDLELMARRVVHLAYGALVARECRRSGIRHLHAHFGQMPATVAWFACDIANLAGGPRSTWSFTIHGFQDFVDEKVARLDVKAERASFVVCVSDFTRSQLCRVANPRTWDRFHVVRCGIDLDAFPLRPPRPRRPVPRIVAVGRLSPEKGHLTLLQALADACSDGPGATLEIVGAGPFEGEIRGEVARLGLHDRVLFSGELPPEEVSRRLSDADIFCMPSYSEGLPISVMEAMAVGVPVISSWISGIPELAVDGVTALTVPPANPAALADAIRRLLRDAELAATLVPNARAAVERMHAIGTNAPMVGALIRGELAGGAPALPKSS